MAVVFTESRAFPKQQMNGYGRLGDNMNTETAIASIFKSLTTGAVDFFGGSSSEAKQAAANAAAAQAMSSQVYAEESANTQRTLIIAGAGLVGVIVLAMALKARPVTVKIKHKKLSGYRRNRKKRSRR